MSERLLKYLFTLTVRAAFRRNENPDEVLVNLSHRALTLVDAGENPAMVGSALESVINSYGLVDQPVPFKVVASLN